MKRNKIYGFCSICNRYNTNYSWCQECNPRLLTQGWTSGNETIDRLIKSTQLKTTKFDNNSYLQWIPDHDLEDLEKIGEGGFSTIYRATWINDFGTTTVVLKKLNHSQNISKEFLNEFENYVKFHRAYWIVHVYGLTRDPITKEYAFVMDYFKDGSLQNYLTKGYKNLKWENKLRVLFDIIMGLEQVHQQEIIHHDLHGGNILLCHDVFLRSCIADLGLSIPANQSTSNKIIGVLPYIAPEVLRGEPYTLKSDIYSFGVLMSLVSTGSQPFCDLEHDSYLAIKICEGIRPGFSINTPKVYIELAYRCMDANPDKRPTAKEIFKTINNWKNFARPGEFNEMDEVGFDPLIIVHPNAVYTSRLLKIKDLPQPVNSTKVTIIGNCEDSRQMDLDI